MTAHAFGPVAAIDLETTTFSSYKRKGNPFDPRNYVCYAGWQIGASGKPAMQRFGRGGPPDGWFAEWLMVNYPLLITGVNIKFDLLHLIHNRPKDLAAYMDWVAAGGILWDSQLAEYLLNGMTVADHMLSMDELAPRYGGNVKFDEVKALWAAGVDTPDIDPALIARYLIGRDWIDDSGEAVREHGDIGNSFLIWQGQYERAKAAGQVKSILMNNGSLLCTIEMERNGMAVDVAKGREIAAKLEVELADYVMKLASYIPEDCPFPFNWGSAAQKSAMIFGGEVKYQKWAPHLDEQGNLQYAMKDALHYIANDGNTYDVNMVAANGGPHAWNLATFAGGKNAGEYKTKKVKVPNLEKPKGAVQDFFYAFPGYTKPDERWKGSTPGQYSTSAEVIAELGNRDIPFLQDLAKRAKLAKDLTTYYVTTDPKTGEETGMLTLVQADGIIHHMLNHTSTVTGRFSSSAPNLQNLPKGGKSEVKTIFVSRFECGKIIQSDFSSLEVYVQAILTKCRQLILDLKAGLDMHCVRVGQTFGIPYEEAVRRCKGYTNDAGEYIPAEPLWEARRTKAKVFSFQRAYGAGAAKIAESTKMPVAEVEALITAENARYPEIEDFNARLADTLEARKEDTGHYVQHPSIPGLTCHLRKASWRTPDGKLYAWKESPAPEFLAKRPASRGGKAQSFSPTETKNYPVQGTGGEWAKAAMWLAVKEFARMQNFNGGALLVNQVHDALYLDATEDCAYEAAVLLHACMEEASTFMEYYFGWLVPVPVPSDTTWGATMGDGDRLPDTFKADVATKRQQVRQRNMPNFTPSCER
jgi:DNA polymerase-1